MTTKGPADPEQLNSFVPVLLNFTAVAANSLALCGTHLLMADQANAVPQSSHTGMHLWQVCVTRGIGIRRATLLSAL